MYDFMINSKKILLCNCEEVHEFRFRSLVPVSKQRIQENEKYEKQDKGSKHKKALSGELESCPWFSDNQDLNKNGL